MEIKVKRRYFIKAQKVSILNDLSISGLSLSELARKYQISPVVLYKWRKKRDINQESVELFPKYKSVVSELEKTKQENEHLKRALGELAVERQILKSAIEILKKKAGQKSVDITKEVIKKIDVSKAKVCRVLGVNRSSIYWKCSSLFWIGYEKPSGIQETNELSCLVEMGVRTIFFQIVVFY